MKKILITLCSSVLLLNAAVAQQLPVSSHYHIDPMIYNPAMVGTGSTGNIFLIHRTQWDNVTGAPQVNTLTFDMPITYDKVGFGININNNDFGLLHRTGGNVSLSYKLLNNFWIGGALGAVNTRIALNNATVQNPNDIFLNNGSDENKTALDGNVGVMYSPGKFQFGVSVPQLFASKFEFVHSGNQTTTVTLTRHVIGTVKYTFDLNKEKGITLYPIVMLRTTQGNIPAQVEGNLVANWARVGWLGFGYRSDDAYYANVGLRFKQFAIGYAYEMPAGDDVRKSLGNTHEVLVSYTFDARPKRDLTAGQDSLFRMVAKLDDGRYHDSINIVDANKRIDKLEANQINPARIDTLEKRVERLTYDFKNSKQSQFNSNNVGDKYNLSSLKFKFNSAEFDADSSITVLTDLAKFLSDNPTLKIALYGHADDIGTDAYNQKLSEKRAKAVYAFLVKCGIKKKRMSYKGYGESKPIIAGETEYARSRNRCTEFEIIAK